MFPLIPVLCFGGIVGGMLGLNWYENLSKQEQDEADRLAADTALRLYAKSVQQLSRQQLTVVNDLVRTQLGC